MGCAGICVHAKAVMTAARKDEQRIFIFFLRGEGLRIVSQLSHFPSTPLSKCGALAWGSGLYIQLVSSIVPMQPYYPWYIFSKRRGSS